MPLGVLAVARARRKVRVPVVLTPEETGKILKAMNGVAALQARLLYGCGLRLMECLRLRIKDVDVEAGTLTVRGGKGDKDRVLTLPRSSILELNRQIEYARALHGSDKA